MKQLTLALMLVLFAVGSALAQRTVSGTIVDATGETLIGASVLVKGTSSGAVTDIDGKYSISVPDGSTTLVVSYTGYSTQEIELGASNILDITLDESATILNEVVVTGLGIRKEKKQLGYGVSTISSADISNRAETDVARILRGKATGVDITQTSGMAGSGTNVIIRGYSSITGSNQPLFVVDGVPFNTDTNTDQGFVNGGATASSRFLDLDPSNIAEISILKGLSATVLYGEAGRNGVVLITTKNGNVGENSQKKMEVSVSQSLHFTEISNLPDYQNTYGNGFSGNFGWFFSNWGPSFDTRGSNGIADDGTIEHPYDQAQFNDDFPEFIGQRYSYEPYESVEQFFQKGVVANTSLSIDKQLGEYGAVSANYSYLDDEGFTPNNNYTKHNFGLGGRTKLGNGLSIKTTFNYIDSERAAPTASVGFGSNPSGSSLFANLIYTPRSIDLFGLPYESPVDGSMVYYRRGAAIQNPRWTLDNASDTEQIKRFFGTINLSYELTDWLTATYRVGIDQYTQQQRRAVNKGGSQDLNPFQGGTQTDGMLATSTRLNTITDHVANLIYDYRINEDWSLDGIVGLNLRRETRDQNYLFSTSQFVFDLFTHDNFTDHVNSSFQQEENTIGAYGTASLGFRSFLYLNVQARNDWTSTLEKDNRSVFYPSASIAFVPTEAIEALQQNDYINYLKVRVGYGTSAGYPNPYQTRNILSTNTNQWVTAGGSVLNTNSVSDRLGNPNLKPELHRELELGLEGRFIKNRFGVDLSWYNKQSSDLIIDLQLDRSTGFTNTTVNAAELSNKGVELGLNFIPFKGDFYWDITLNYTRNVNIVEAVAEGVDQVVIAGFSNLGNFAIPGEPYGVIQGLPYERAENGQRLVGVDGNYIPASDIAPIGNPNPNYQANLINTFSYKNLSFGFHWNYIDGGDIYSVTTATMLARGNTVDTDFDRFLPIVQPGVKDSDGVTPNDVQGYAGDLFFRSYFFADEGTIFDGTTIRLREVSLSFDVPTKYLDNSPFGAVSLRFSGENLWYKAVNFPEGVNFDPEVLSLGVGNGRGFDFVTGPTAKKYGVSLNVTF